MHLMLKSPAGKIPVRKGAAQPAEMDSVVSLIGGYASATVGKPLELDKTDDTPSTAARCLPYSSYDRSAKYKVVLHVNFDLISYKSSAQFSFSASFCLAKDSNLIRRPLINLMIIFLYYASLPLTIPYVQQKRGKAVAYRVTGVTWNTIENINSLRVSFSAPLHFLGCCEVLLAYKKHQFSLKQFILVHILS